MTKKISFRLLLLICLTLLCVASLVTLAACSTEEDPEDFVNQQGNTVRVLLDSIKSGVIDYRIKPGSPIPQPGVTPNTTAPTAEGFIFDGYYTGTKDANGNVTYGEKWDFSTKVNKDITLYGKWLKQYVVRVNFVLDGKLQDSGENYNVTNNATTISALRDPTWTGNTFVQLYRDKECKQELVISTQSPFEHGCTQENPICNIYAKFIEGSWTLVRTATDLRSINAGSRLYLMNDIDMSPLYKNGRTDITAADSFGGVIEGNGYTISNLHYVREGSSTGAISYSHYCVGLFAQLNKATIRNITFENCSVEGSIRRQNSEYFYGFIAGRALGECTFENISFVNCELKELQFNIATLNSEQNEAEKEKLEQGFFVGDGSDYQPSVKNNIEALKALVQLG